MECEWVESDLVIIPCLSEGSDYTFYYPQPHFLAPPADPGRWFNVNFIEYKIYDVAKQLEQHFAYLKSRIELWFKCY